MPKTQTKLARNRDAEHIAWRKCIRARLAAERAGLLEQLLGLDETTLTDSPVADGRTAKEIMDFISSCDTDATGLIGALASGGVSNSINPDHRIHLSSLQCRDWSLDESVARMMLTRTRFLDMLARVDDQRLEKRIDLREGFTSAISSTEERYRFDRRWALVLERWSRGGRVGTSIGPWSILLAALGAARKEMLTTIALVPTSERPGFRLQAAGTSLLQELRTHKQSSELICTFLGGPEAPPREVTVDSTDWDFVWRALNESHHRMVVDCGGAAQEQRNRVSDEKLRMFYDKLTEYLSKDRRLAARLRSELGLRVPKRLLG